MTKRKALSKITPPDPGPDHDGRCCPCQQGGAAWLAGQSAHPAPPPTAPTRHRILESDARPDRDVLTATASPIPYFRGPSFVTGQGRLIWHPGNRRKEYGYLWVSIWIWVQAATAQRSARRTPATSFALPDESGSRATRQKARPATVSIYSPTALRSSPRRTAGRQKTSADDTNGGREPRPPSTYDQVRGSATHEEQNWLSGVSKQVAMPMYDPN
jgi:hypothetical protein